MYILLGEMVCFDLNLNSLIPESKRAPNVVLLFVQDPNAS